MGLIDRLKAKAGEVAGDIFDAGVQKLKETIDEVHAFAPHFRKVGYRLEQLEVELSLSPRVILHLDRDFEATDEQFEAVLANAANQRTMSLVVKALYQANQLQSRLGLQASRFRGLEMEVGIPPVARMKYVESAQAPGEQGAGA
jgi:hypothetical protein